MVHRALGASEHGVVVRHDDAPRACVAKERSVHSTDARDHAIGRSPSDQVFDGSTPSLSREDQRAVLDECSVIDEVCDVLARGPLTGLSTLRNGFRPILVETKRVAIDHLCEISSNMAERSLRADLRWSLDVLSGYQEHQGIPGCHHLVGSSEHLLDDPAPFRADDVLHLHRFEDHERLTGRYCLTDLRTNADDQCLHGGSNLDDAFAHLPVLAASALAASGHRPFLRR